ncbi:MAG: extracellular solute-binding protein [Proteobacteria bacterium]|nr:extracellular solute-binding protein [Pseudomonadota bacterium]
MVKSAHPRASQRLAAALLAVAALLGGAPIAAQQDNTLNIYSYRQEFLLRPLLDAFKAETGVESRVVYLESGALERLKAEGRNSPADVVLTADVAQIVNMANAGLLQPVQSAALEANVPQHLQDSQNRWFGLTQRGRILVVAKDRPLPRPVASYEDLTDPALKGKICTRPGKHPYNVTLLASIVAVKGEAAAEEWARGVKANLARKPQGNDRAQVKAVKEGVCDIALINTYYMGLMATNDTEPEQKKWAQAVRMVFPNQPGQGDGHGTHVNASAGAVTASAPHRAIAVRFLEFLSGSAAQKIYAAENFEYPVKAGSELHPIVKSWGDFKTDTVSVERVAELIDTAAKIMDIVGYDL